MRDIKNKKLDSLQLAKGANSISERNYMPNLVGFFEIPKIGKVQLQSFS